MQIRASGGHRQIIAPQEGVDFMMLVVGDAKRFFIQIWMVGYHDDEFQETLCLSENSPPS